MAMMHRYDHKMLSKSISEHLFFKIFLERHAPRPPSINMLHMLHMLHTITITHHPKLSIQAALQLVGLITENFSYSPNLMVAGEVPKGVKDLPSVLMSWMRCVGEILLVLTYFLLTTEQEAPESNNNCVW